MGQVSILPIGFEPLKLFQKIPLVLLIKQSYDPLGRWEGWQRLTSINFSKKENSWILHLDRDDALRDSMKTYNLPKKNKWAVWRASEVFLQGTKWTILLNQLTITKIESDPRWVQGNPKRKSIHKSSQILLGMGTGE